MVDRWSEWKTFPAQRRGEHLDAPVGPGLYELRHRSTGEVLGFGQAANVAAALTRHFTPSLWERMIGRNAPDVRYVEYRTMSARDKQHARAQAASIAWRREAFWGHAA
jgi:hypothetical protein